MSEKTCGICQNKFHLHDHQSGLVFDGKIFVCEICSKSTSEHDITEWSRSIMQKPGCGMPIALWLIHEQNKDKPMFSKRK
ncbi:MAG: hypothetical protein JSW06_08130 [Thermoplasmatales archaeon]|nr:MAG: hypothetical protein JSW06_08130 [Thermoplasmatales archaeon]